VNMQTFRQHAPSEKFNRNLQKMTGCWTTLEESSDAGSFQISHPSLRPEFNLVLKQGISIHFFVLENIWWYLKSLIYYYIIPW
jgi:hypothetical protein